MKKNLLLTALIIAFLVVTVGLIASLASNLQTSNSIWYEDNIANIKSSFNVDKEKASAIYEILAACKRDGAIEYISRWNDKSTGETYYRVRFADGDKADVYLYDNGTVKVTDGDIVLYEGGLYGVDAVTDTATEPDVADNGKDNDGDKPNGNGTGSDKDKETQKNNDSDTKTTDGNTGNNIETSNNEPSSGSGTTPDAETTTNNNEKDTEASKPTDTETLPAVETTKANTETETTQDNTQKIEIIVNKSTKKFHYTYCSYVSRMKEENKLTIFVSSLSEAEDMGYSHCSYCTGKSK